MHSGCVQNASGTVVCMQSQHVGKWHSCIHTYIRTYMHACMQSQHVGSRLESSTDAYIIHAYTYIHIHTCTYIQSEQVHSQLESSTAAYIHINTYIYIHTYSLSKCTASLSLPRMSPRLFQISYRKLQHAM